MRPLRHPRTPQRPAARLLAGLTLCLPAVARAQTAGLPAYAVGARVSAGCYGTRLDGTITKAAGGRYWVAFPPKDASCDGWRTADQFRPTAPAPAPARAPAPRAAGGLAMGEYACYGVGTRLMAGMGFVLRADGTYRDVDGGRGGRYAFDARARTVVFRGGFLGGQTGRNLSARSAFDLSSTVNCEPW